MKARWLIRRDMAEILDIDSSGRHHGDRMEEWDAETFIFHLRQRNIVGMVVEDKDENVVGYILYELHPTVVRVIRFAVLPSKRRQGYGTYLMTYVINKPSNLARKKIAAQVPIECWQFATFLDSLVFQVRSNREDPLLMEHFV